MPSQKSRSKEDTWTTDELNKALKPGDRRHHRDRDDDRKRDRLNGEDKHRRRKEDDSDDRRRRRKEEEDESARLTEDDREKQRRERREKREKDSKPKKGEITYRGKTDGTNIDLQEVEEPSDDRQRRTKDDRDRRHKDDRGHRDRDDDRERRERRHREADEDGDRRRRHRDVDDDEAERERRRIERRKGKESKEDAEKRRRHEEKKEKRRLEEEKDRRRDRDERDKHKDRKDRDRDRDKDKSRDERRREKEREERKREKEEEEARKHKSKRHEEKKKEEKKEEEEDEYNYEEDFEDYEEDFEEDDDDDDDDDNNNVKDSIHKETKRGTELDYSDSEVSAVLKALDAENDRLIRDSSDSPKAPNNRRHDEDEDSDDQYEKTYQPRMDRPRTAINFVSAKQRAINKHTSSKTMQRGSDLLKMLELDFNSFDLLDMPPVNEYDLYIRAFGGSNTTQAYVQTNDDNVDRDIQTEEVDSRQKWTQHPPDQFSGCGRGDGEKDFEEEEEFQAKQNKEQQDTSRLTTFLEKAGQVIAILLEEGREDESENLGKKQANISISEGYSELEILPILAGRHVVYSHFSPVQPNLLLTIYSPSSDISSENPISKRGIICVWNTSDPAYPQKILACASQPRCCCFSPVKPSLVFAGMQDGSIAMWDLREAVSLHRPTVINDQMYSLRYPTYDTAAVLSEENHHSPVACISPIYSYINSSKSGSTVGSQPSSASDDNTSGLSFQLVSTEETGMLHFWVVAELAAPDMSGSPNDYGLAPGGTVKLIKSSSLSPESSSQDMKLKVGGIRALDMKLLPADPNQYYIATDSGCVLHGIRFGKRAYPRAHLPVIESIVDVLSIDFSPFEKPCFLAGCSDGSFSLYHTKSANPLITWPTITKGKAVSCVRWSRSRPCVFYILDAASTLYVFDLLEGDMGPKYTEQISKDRVVNFSMTNDYKTNGLGIPGKIPQILFCLENGRTEIHTVTKTLREPEDLETDYLASYLQRF